MEASPSHQVAIKPLRDGDAFSPILLPLSLPYLALLPGRQYSKVVYVDTPLLTALREGDTPVLGPSPVLLWGWPGLAGGRSSCPEATAHWPAGS